MRKYIFVFLLLSLISCNQIENNKTLNQDDINFVKTLKILDTDETIYKFYSENTNETAGNFFTNKRVASYWIDKHNSEKNEINFAFYNSIIKIDTITKVGLTYCPYALITRNDGSTFKLSVEGKKQEVKSFFTDLLFHWRNNKK